MEKVQNEKAKYRRLTGPVYYLWMIILALLPILGTAFILSIHQHLGIVIFSEQYIGLFLGLVLLAVFMGVPRNGNLEYKVPWYDWILGIAGLIVGMYVAIYYPVISLNYFEISTVRFIISFLAVVILLEALRRLMGWMLVGVVFVFLLYALFSPYMPGVLRGEPIKIDILFNYIYIDTNSILSLTKLAGTIVLAFILFGQILLNFNGADIFNNLAMRMFGRYRGGTAKASVVGSSMVGSVTGDPVSNVILVGNMTIPMMVRSGYTRVQAGAIESLASTAGVVTPPVMGVVAFMVAENLGVPYAEVAIAAFIPALFYYLSLFIQVDLGAAKRGISGISKQDLPKTINVLKTSWLLIPIFGAIVYFLFIKGSSPATAGVYSTFVAILFLLFQKSVHKDFFKRILNSLVETGRTLLQLTVILSAAGIIAGIIGITGLGYNLALALTQLGQYGLFPLLIACALGCIILGMGMPGLVAYAIVATLISPALIELGVNPMAAHLFVLYFAIVSNFTLPIAIASFAAAPIAKASPHKISLEAMKMGIMVYIIPFLFVYNPVLLLDFHKQYEFAEVLTIGLTTVGVITTIIGISGYFMNRLDPITRTLLIVASTFLLIPFDIPGIEKGSQLVGLVCIIIILIFSWVYSKKNKSDFPHNSTV